MTLTPSLRSAVAAMAIALLAACTPPADESGGETIEAPPTDAASAVQQVEGPKGEPAPAAFSSTAWRVVAADGARYTTFLDPDGTYRDMRNGDPYQTGEWTHDVAGQGELCFTPDGEDSTTRCWEPGRMRGETMTVTGGEDRRIEAERVTYRSPEADQPEP